MSPLLLPWVILFLPFLAMIGIALFTSRNQKLSAGLSIAAVVAGFFLAVIFIGINGWRPDPAEGSITWLNIGKLAAEFGLRVDALSLGMVLVVTGVGGLIHIYSWRYMAGDPGFSRYFAFLSLFTFSMLGIVFANNFLQLFIFWELVGVSSYLLIGFWFEKPSAADAGKKAFIVNRLGDFGFLLGILMIWSLLGSLNFAELEATLKSDPRALGTMATVAGLLVFCGAVGKSAQFPLHVWLPDAMEGPTPVSALIHAATMVAAGVYMLCRVLFLFTPEALHVIAWIGAFTALLAAVIAVQQDDIKRILAYSTLSQLGYMMMAVGLNGPSPAMFHLTTHAFFKALLFLGAGSVILACHHEQNIWAMGSLRKKMPVTFWTFVSGTVALAGVWPLSGFYSKDAILAQALAQKSFGFFAVGAFVAALTAFYMFRLVLVVFYGEARADSASHAHESDPTILWPLRLLAVLSIIGGIIGVEALYAGYFDLRHESHGSSLVQSIFAPFTHSPVAAFVGLSAAAAGFFGAWTLYRYAERDPLPTRLGALSRAMRDRFYFDEFYEATVIRIHDALGSVAAWVDRWLISGLLVRGTHGTTELLGRALRLAQTGNLQTYAFLFVLGLALVLFFTLR
jgi:NADH-quinone oxidoreductase subunit L